MVGFYCPAGGKEKIACPAGSYCPQGSYQPTKCDWGASCPENSSRQLSISPLWVIIAIDLAVLVLVLSGFAFSRWRKRRRIAYAELDTSNMPAEDIEDLSGLPQSKASAPPADEEPGTMNIAYKIISGRVRSTSLGWSLPSSPRLRAHSTASSVSGFGDDESTLPDLEDVQNPQMQRFLSYLSRIIQAKEIGLAFDFHKLCYETKKGHKLILSDITGNIARGSFWGVMGGSGAGKSTFLNVLMGKRKASSGAIKINGWAANSMKRYKIVIGYVPQDDIVIPELTVRENLLHSARMRLPSSWKDKLIQEFVDSLIDCLALSHVRDSLVGDVNKPVISGGQRKRVSIGLELAAAPMAIFLDEPTSGLDATSAASVMKLLKAISHLGVTVIAIIHQPREDIWTGFDQLLLLAQGRQVYAGETREVVPYFESMGYQLSMRGNPADTIMDIITGDGQQYLASFEKNSSDVNKLIEFWQNKGQYGRMGKHLSADFTSDRLRRISGESFQSTVEQETAIHRTMEARGASWAAQVYYCCKRSITQQMRNRTSFLFEIGVGGLAGVIIGLSAFSSQGALFQGIFHPPFTILSGAVDYSSVPQIGLLSAMAIGLAASAPGVWVFGEEKLVYYRESAAGHSRSAYYVGKVLSTLPRIALSALHYTAFMGILATPLMSFSQMYAANVGYFYAIYGGASIVSMVVKREDGPLLAVLASLILGILGGVAPPLSKVKSWHMQWFWRLSPGVWFTEAYFSQNLLPLKHLYLLDLASETIGFTIGQYALDIGYVSFPSPPRSSLSGLYTRV